MQFYSGQVMYEVKNNTIYPRILVDVKRNKLRFADKKRSAKEIGKTLFLSVFTAEKNLKKV